MTRRKKILFAGVAGFLALLLLEGLAQVLLILGGVRWPAPAEANSILRPDPDLGWTFRGSRPQEFEGQVQGVLRFNSLGLRGGELGSGPVELMFLGDSVTMGQAVIEERTFSSLLGGINGGQDGYDTYQLRDLYRRDLASLAPKHLVLIICVNDVMSACDSKTNCERGRRLAEYYQNRHRPLEYEAFYRFYLFRRGIIGRVEKQDNQEAAYLNQTRARFSPETWGEWTQAVLDLRDAARGAPFSILYPPHKSQLQAYRSGEKEFAFNQALADFASRHGIPFLDLTAALSKEDPETLFVDAVHFNEKGHQLVAHGSAEFLGRPK